MDPRHPQAVTSNESVALPPSPPPSCAARTSGLKSGEHADAIPPPPSPDDNHDTPPEHVLSPEPTVKSEPKKRRRKRKALKQVLEKLNPTMTLENSGSVARDHLASERTFLAYVRTSLAIASTGVALVQLFTIAAEENKSLTRYSRPLGATIIIIGLCTLFLGVVRYFTVQVALVQGIFPVARVSTVLIALALCAIITAVFGILLANRG